jgi:hypothetical protein
LRLTTAADIEVISQTSLVLRQLPPAGAAETGAPGIAVAEWLVIPGDQSRVSFSCRRRVRLQEQEALLMAGGSASHVLSGDMLSSRWVLPVPAVAEAGMTLSFGIPAGTGLLEVTREGGKPLDWRVEDAGPAGLRLAVTLPRATMASSINVSAVTESPGTATWNVPMLRPEHWKVDRQEDGAAFTGEAKGETQAASRRGPLVMPVSQISVRLPSSILLQDWVRVGVEETDLVVAADESQEFQFVQFLPEASLLARTSQRTARLTESVVTLVEPAGRFATVRCLVNVSCRDRAVVELEWPVAPGWQVVSARYASDLQALYFESLPMVSSDAGPAGTTAVDEAANGAPSRLLLHLPESLEPGSSRVLELQMQRSDVPEFDRLELPLQAGANIERQESLMILPPAELLLSNLWRSWTSGAQPLSADEVRARVPWLPANRLTADAQVWPVSSAPRPLSTRAGTEEPAEVRVLCEHVIRVLESQILETSQITLPDSATGSDVLIVQVADEAGGDMLFYRNGEPVAGSPVTLQDTVPVEPASGASEPLSVPPGWSLWSVPLSGHRAGQPVVVRMELARPVRSSFVAGVAWPVVSQPVEGAIRVLTSEEQTLKPVDAVLLPARSVGPGDATSSAAWQLPAQPSRITLQVERTPQIDRGPTIDVQMLHLFSEHEGALRQSVLATAAIDVPRGQSSLLLSLADDIRPAVLVNGQRVKLRRSPAGLLVPLPESAGRCQLLATWEVPAAQSDDVTGERDLPRLFVQESGAPQGTHHLLIEPVLELRAPEIRFSAVDHRDASRIAEERLSRYASDRAVPETMPVEFRDFLTRWHVAEADGWQSQTLIDTGVSARPLVVRLTQASRRRTITVGAALLAVAACIAARTRVLRYRLLTLLLPLVFLIAGVVIPVTIAAALCKGVFWGLTAGLLVILLPAGVAAFRSSRRPGETPLIMRDRAGSGVSISSGVTISALLFLLTAPQAKAQRPPVIPSIAREAAQATATPGEPAPEILLPLSDVAGSNIAWVRRSVLQRWQRDGLWDTAGRSEAVVESARVQVIAENQDAVELTLTIHVAVQVSPAAGVLTIPLQDSRLVDCQVDGVVVYPETAADGQLAIPLPAAVLVAPQQLQLREHEVRRDANAEGREWDDDTAVTLAVPAPDRRSGFVQHVVQCRLRPQVTREPGQVVLRVPAVPCPQMIVAVEDRTAAFEQIRLQSPAGQRTWTSDAGEINVGRWAMAGPLVLRMERSLPLTSDQRPARASLLAVQNSESGRPQITLVARFQSWNPVNAELLWTVPAGFRLTSVSQSNETVIGESSELLWSVANGIASIRLPAPGRDRFTLQLQLLSSGPLETEEQQVPVSELCGFQGCQPGAQLLIGMRVHPAFSVRQRDEAAGTAVPWSAELEEWGSWLRRTDSLFRVATARESWSCRLVPRQTLNEVQIVQDVRLRDVQVDWSCQMTIDSSVLPVFRHRLVVPAEWQVREVRVSAGEANRLGSWNRQGDALVVQLREATTGPHVLTVSGIRAIGPDDLELTVPQLRLEGGSVLESSLTLTDEAGLDLIVDELGGTVPGEVLEPGAVLQPGQPLRLEVLRDSEPLVLRRERMADPRGTALAVDAGDQVFVAVRVEQWSGRLGPLRLSFSPLPAFVASPVVLAGSRRFVLSQDGAGFFLDAQSARSLFGESEFVVAWSVPVSAPARESGRMELDWPQFSGRVVWSDAAAGGGNDPTAVSGIPQWLTDAAAQAAGPVIAAASLRSIASEALTGVDWPRPAIVLSPPVDPESGGRTNRVTTVTDTVVWLEPSQSPVGESLVVMFAAGVPAIGTLTIPEGIVVTELDSDDPVRWQDNLRNRLQVEMNGRVCIVRMRWLSERMAASLLTTERQLEYPFCNNSEGLSRVRLISGDGSLPIIRNSGSLQVSGAGTGRFIPSDPPAIRTEGVRPSGELFGPVFNDESDGGQLANAGEDSWIQVPDGTTLESAIASGLSLVRPAVPATGLPSDTLPEPAALQKRVDDRTRQFLTSLSGLRSGSLPVAEAWLAGSQPLRLLVPGRVPRHLLLAGSVWLLTAMLVAFTALVGRQPITGPDRIELAEAVTEMGGSPMESPASEPEFVLNSRVMPENDMASGTGSSAPGRGPSLLPETHVQPLNLPPGSS